MMHRILLSLLLGLPAVAAAQQQPLWEMGMGASALTFAAYRGADHRETYLLPLPYLVYRGDVFRVDRDGIRGLLFDSDRAVLDISLNAAAPVDSGDIPEREGMPSLAPVFELGPSINVRLVGEKPGPVWEFRLPVRAVFAVEDGLQQAGWIAQPKLNLAWDRAFAGWNVGFSTGPQFADRRYHSYYYGVDPQYATVTRPAYEADAGYSGLVTIATLSRRQGNLWVAGFVRYDNLSGTAFHDSPLVKTEHSVMAGVGVAWVFARSAEMVDVED